MCTLNSRFTLVERHKRKTAILELVARREVDRSRRSAETEGANRQCRKHFNSALLRIQRRDKPAESRSTNNNHYSHWHRRASHLKWPALHGYWDEEAGRRSGRLRKRHLATARVECSHLIQFGPKRRPANCKERSSRKWLAGDFRTPRLDVEVDGG
jgi:hypothetical protein